MMRPRAALGAILARFLHVMAESWYNHEVNQAAKRAIAKHEGRCVNCCKRKAARNRVRCHKCLSANRAAAAKARNGKCVEVHTLEGAGYPPTPSLLKDELS